MIDTDRYEGYATEGWRRPNGSAYPILKATNNADAELMADAPLLLAEVKRFNEMQKWLLEHHPNVILQYTYGRVD